MPRIYRLILFLLCILAMTIVAWQLIGGTRPNSSLAAVMTGPDGTACNNPCLFGVLPGKTSLKEVLQILHSHPLTRDAKWLNDNSLQLNGPEAYVAFSLTDDGVVDSITLADNLHDTGIPVHGSLADSITLGDLISAFGAPTVELPGSDYFVVEFVPVAITAASARPRDFTTRIQADTPLSMVMLYVFGPCPSSRVISEAHPWMGFRTIERYAHDTRLHKGFSRLSGVPLPPFAPCQP